MYKKLIVPAFMLGSILALTSCGESEVTETTKSTSATTQTTVVPTTTTVELPNYKFVIYAPDSNNNDLSDNTVVATYTMYVEEGDKYVTDTFFKVEENKYFFSSDSEDYLVLADSKYGLSYTHGYFKNYEGCKDGAIDVSWSMTLGNGVSLSTGIGGTEVAGLSEYQFVIDGWKQ